MTLPVNIDTTYADDGADASVQLHQADHDALHAAYNARFLTALVSKSASFTLALTDAEGKLIPASSSSAIVVTVPTNASVAFPVGSSLEVARMGSGALSFTAAGGVTIRAAGGLIVSRRYDVASLVKIATDEWLLVGNLE